jgi:A/G-specific adenine glycosylase
LRVKARGNSNADRGAEISIRLGRWFEKNRRDLPWRKTKAPYAIWLSEIMLQQTRVKTVEDYFPRFLRRYPSVQSLAKAELAEVLVFWSGLGYYRRARALHAGAREVVAEYGGKLPPDAASLRQISGIGPYTAGAIASIAFGAREPAVDGNVARVLSRIFALTCDVRSPAGAREVWARARKLVPQMHAGRHNEALMELGATVCLPAAPRCAKCPLGDVCHAHSRGLEKRLPIVGKRRAPRQVDLCAVVSRRGSRLLLARRRPGGLFGGLWEPPMVELRAGEHPEASLASLFGTGRLELCVVGHQTHLLTHRKLRITIATADIPGVLRAPPSADYDRFEWRGSADRRRLGMSSLAKKILLACPGST